MNKNRRLVTLDANIVRVSREFGEAIKQWYASPTGMISASRSRSGEWGAESDPIRQGQAKAGEYAVALFFGLDPKTAIKRTVGQADQGTDVLLGRIAADVKTTPSRKQYLIWSRDLNDLYWTGKTFDVLVSVSINEDDWSQCWIEGWLTKQEFFDRKKIADGINDGGRLGAGTWFIEKDAMSDVDSLLTESRKGFVGYDSEGRFIHYCQCGKWGAHGFGVSLLKDQLGEWYCSEHIPKPPAPPPQPPPRPPPPPAPPPAQGSLF